MAFHSKAREGRDDMGGKALSWALRELARRDPEAARDLLDEHRGTLAVRVMRELTHKLTAGPLKTAPTPSLNRGDGEVLTGTGFRSVFVPIHSMNRQFIALKSHDAIKKVILNGKVLEREALSARR